MSRRGGVGATLALPWSSTGRPSGGRSAVDGVTLGLVVMLALLGLVVVYSASAVMAGNKFHDSLYFLKRQTAWLALGFVLLHVASRVDYMVWRKLAYPLLGVTLVLLTLVLLPSMGVTLKGARRWLSLGPFMMQPAELAKLAVVIYLAAYLARKEDRVQDLWSGFLPPLLVVGLCGGLILSQPDLGTVIMMWLVAAGMLFLAGARLLHLFGLGLVASLATMVFVWGSHYRTQRLKTFLAPWDDPLNAGFQVTQSFLAFGSGGTFGVGLGEGKQKLYFLPEAHTDFVLALVGEELGLVGTATLLGVYAVLVLRGFRIAGRARKPFGGYLAHGLIMLFGLQALLNAGVVTGLLPTKGMTLPLISYGGSSLIVTLLALGILLSVSRDRQGGRQHGGYGTSG